MPLSKEIIFIFVWHLELIALPHYRVLVIYQSCLSIILSHMERYFNTFILYLQARKIIRSRRVS